jgi:hypothetical protein
MNVDDEEEEEELNVEGRRRVPTGLHSAKNKERLIYEGEDEEEEDADHSAKWKANLLANTAKNFTKTVNLMDIIYGNYTNSKSASSHKNDSDDFFTIKRESTSSLDTIDSSKFVPTNVINLVDNEEENSLVKNNLI